MKSLLAYWQSLSGKTSTVRSQGVEYELKAVDGGFVGLASTRYGSCFVFWTPSQRPPVSDLCDELPAFEIKRKGGFSEEMSVVLPSGHDLYLDPWVRAQLKEVLEAYAPPV